jgi:predicted transglutaminase-like cysteine proteinase
VRHWVVAAFRGLCGAAAGAVLAFACTPQPAAAGPMPLLLASVAPDQNPVQAPVGRLPKWQRIRDWLEASGAGSSDPALAEWSRWAASLRAEPAMERLSAINLRVNQSFRFASDFEVWGVADYWETPSEVVAKRATDCEGFAIFKYWLARLAGIPDDQLLMMVGILTSTHQMHAVLLAGVADRSYVLDSLTPYVGDVAAFGDFRLLATVDLREVEVFIQGFGGPAATTTLGSN